MHIQTHSVESKKKQEDFTPQSGRFKKKSQIGTITPRPGDHLILCVPMAKADFKKKNNPQQHTGLLLFWHFQVAFKKKYLFLDRVGIVRFTRVWHSLFLIQKKTLYALVLFSFTFLGGIMKSVSIQEIINWCLKKG